jgi:DNA polymerase I
VRGARPKNEKHSFTRDWLEQITFATMAKKLFLLDGHALVYRAHYAFIARPLMNSKGQNVSAVTGFMNSLLELISKEQPTHIAVAFDPRGGTFRNEIFEDYKANRDAQPEDIGFALPYLRRIIEAMRIPIVMVDNYEADDVIGTLAHRMHDKGFDVYMVTPDKDYGQLVRDGVYMYKPARSGNDHEVWGPKEICENWGIKRPEQVIDILGLQGDSVDNIPGVPGIGPKTAATLLAQFDTLEGVLANTDKLKGKQKETLEANADKARLSYVLATIETNVPIDFEEEDSLWHTEFDIAALKEIIIELEIRSLGDKLLRIVGSSFGTEGGAANDKVDKDVAAIAKTVTSGNAQQQQLDLFGEPVVAAKTKANVPEIPVASLATKNILNSKHTYHLCNTTEEQQALAARLLTADAFAFDTETTALDATQADLVGLSFCIEVGEAWYVPVPADRAGAQAIVNIFKPALEKEGIEKTGQNLKYDMMMLARYEVRVAMPIFDTMLAHYVYEPEMRHNMDYLAEVYLGYKTISIEELIGKKGKNQGTMRDVALDIITDYAAEDADITQQLKEWLLPKVQECGRIELLQSLEFPLVPVLADMELEGIRIDAAYLESYSHELRDMINETEANVYTAAGFTFNIGSPKQVGEALFDRLKLPYKGSKNNKSGQYSTDEEILAELSIENPVAKLILHWRGLTKLLGTYVDALPKMINPLTGRVHSSFNQALAATGRLSSNNPNLQNIPIKTPEGRRVREAFVPRDKDHVLVSADYSQVELRLVAAISNETAMIEAFQKGLDIHQSTAALVYNVPLEAVTSDQRRNAKTVNFSILYGAGANNVSQQLGIPKSEAKMLIDNYYATYGGLRDWMKATVENARTDGYVTTLLGRRRYLRDIDSRNGLARSLAERIAVNSPVQGSAADLIKKAMIDIHYEINKQGLKSRLVLQVHDELVFDVPRTELDLMTALIKDKMQNAIPNLSVPIEVGVGFGMNWLEAH